MKKPSEKLTFGLTMKKKRSILSGMKDKLAYTTGYIGVNDEVYGNVYFKMMPQMGRLRMTTIKELKEELWKNRKA